MLVWAAGARRPEVEEALRPLDGHHTVTKLESFILTKLTKHFVPVNLVGPQVRFRNGAPQMSGGGIIFWAGEARLKKKHGIRWMDTQQPLLL